MRSISTFDRIFLYKEPVDLRKQTAGLAIVVEQTMKLDPFSKYLFVFTNKRRKQIRMLYWDETGFALWLKKLEKEHYKWPKHFKEKNISLTPELLGFILSGYDLAKIKSHKKLNYKAIS